MSELFLKTVNMSVSAGWVVIAVLLMRLVLRKAPKWITVLMWGIVAVRLVCPFTVESVLSLIPSTETVSPDIMMDPTPTIHTGISVINSSVNPVMVESLAPSPGDSVNPLQIWIPILALVWLCGVVILLVYTLVSYIRLRLKVKTAVLLSDSIYQSENVTSPFVIGVIKPKIYLPFNMSERDAEHVIAHEQAHVRRRDHLWKPLGFLLLTVHWFNPLMWLGYVLLCRDIELACDEKVVKALDGEQRADYSQALLNCSVDRRMIAACPLAFGEVGVKGRVKSVLNYKKPAFWIIIIAIIACVALAVCFLTDPKTPVANDETLPDTDSISTDLEPDTNSTSIDHEYQAITSYINTLRDKYPMYFDLPTSKGLELYVWQMSEDSYSCGLLPGKNMEYTDEEIWALQKSPATMEEMLAIVLSYEIDNDLVAVCPVTMPHSSYSYIIDEAYCKKVEQLFWYEDLNSILDLSGSIIEGATFDIDGDGKKCILRRNRG